MVQEDNERSRGDKIHVWLMAYNGIVILVLAAFMAATQEHIVRLERAREFLYGLPMVPVEAGELLLGIVVSFTVLVCCSYVYSNVSRLPGWFRYCVFALEVGSGIFLLSSLKLSYDGVVLLLLADFMCCYQGEQQLKIMLVMMAVLYGIISFSIWSLGQQMISFDMYLNVYSTDTRNLMLALKSFAGYGNIMLFVVYMATLLQDVSKEKAEIADLNYRMIKTNELLQESNNKVNASNKNLHKANQKLREYAMTIASLTEIKERNRLAREIHDTLGHALTGMITGLDACIMTMDCAPEVAKRQLGKIQEAARKGIVDVRRSMHMLRPDDLEKLTTREALEKLVEDFAGASLVEASLEIDNLPENLREDQAETVYRIVQEGLTNAARHGHATRVRVFVLGARDRLNIIVSDNGIGCSNIKNGFGLTHMKERLQMLGGTLKCWSEKGFVLEASFALNIEGVRQ